MAMDTDIDNMPIALGNFDEGDLTTKSFMLNGFYDINTGSPWTPFVGAGIG